jgi:quinol monooxygenase YgiN
MYGGLIKLVVPPERRAELLEFLRWDADVARTQEPGTLRFDVWEAPDEPNALFLYEAYVDRAAFDAHKEGEPYQRFMAEVVPQMLEEVSALLPFTDSLVSNADV